MSKNSSVGVLALPRKKKQIRLRVYTGSVPMRKKDNKDARKRTN